MTEQQITAIRSQLAEAHRLIIVATQEPGRSPTEDALIDAIRCVATVAAELVDVCVELNDRVPMSTEAFGEILGGK